LSIGILVALYAASGGMNATMAALDRCYDVEIGRKFVFQRFVAALLTITVATLILLVLCLVPVTTQIVSSETVRQYLNLEGVWGYVFNFSRYFIALMLCLTILSLVYHFGPSVRSHWSWISPGSVFVVTVWAILAFAFRYYIDNFAAASYAKTYGVVGSIVLLLLVLYVDAIVLLIGAEINSEIDFAVLGLSSSANRGQKTPARENLSNREKVMLLELQRRRPGATAMDAMAARGQPVETTPDPAADGPVYPIGEKKQV
jgi:membrane protein